MNRGRSRLASDYTGANYWAHDDSLTTIITVSWKRGRVFLNLPEFKMVF